MNAYKGYDLDNLERKCVKEIADYSRRAGSEGIVLLKNDGVLPFEASKTLSIFGRTQIDYVKSGTGSGGLVHTPYVVNIACGLDGKIKLNTELLGIYKEWIKENPFNSGSGWGKEPWAQKEMPITAELCQKAAQTSDYALVVIGRTAGEDRDNFGGEGGYLLTADEENMIKLVCEAFDKVCVALNVGNIIDMGWVEKYSVPSVLYCWQGGMEGGNALADVLLGDVSPSGHLTDTIAKKLTDYPSNANYGASDRNIYVEDIYVGYRYFETFSKNKVIYPFGYGLSYTTFTYTTKAVVDKETIKLSVKVKNTGKHAGKAVVQVYFSAPQGNFGKPVRELVRYAKTDTIRPNKTQVMELEFEISDMASYDDEQKFAYILERGEYVIYVGDNVRDAQPVLTVPLSGALVNKLRQALAPVESFKRIKPVSDEDKYTISYDDVTTRAYNIKARKKEHLSIQKPSTGDCGIKLSDVRDGKNTLDDFILQLSGEELTWLVKGEGMNSSKVTAGTASAFGGVTDELRSYGIPPVCTSDGPSGLRMDTGHRASLIPNGTCLASTWNDALVEELHSYVGIELRANKVDMLLSPGINIHRHPLNGRNFEYFSEDPYISGKMASACVKGLAKAGVSGTLKHFACNSQEYKRGNIDSIVSERALREIYLKPFEIAVRDGFCGGIMTAYNRINGSHCASNYDLCTSILRDEWGFKGFVMTDWWARVDSSDGGNKENLKEMVIAQNDVYMVTKSAKENSDNLTAAVRNESIDIAYLRQCAKNILTFIMSSPAMDREPRAVLEANRDEYIEVAKYRRIKKGVSYNLSGAELIEIEYMMDSFEFGQYLINLIQDGEFSECIPVPVSQVNKPNIELAEIDPYAKPVMFEYPDAFRYINITVLKKR